MQSELKSISQDTWRIINSPNVPMHPVVYAGREINELCRQEAKSDWRKAFILASLACRSDSVSYKPFFAVDENSRKIQQVDGRYPVKPHPYFFTANLGMVMNIIDNPNPIKDQYNFPVIKERLGIDLADKSSHEYYRDLMQTVQAKGIYDLNNNPQVSLYTAVLEAAARTEKVLSAQQIAEVSSQVLKWRTSFGQRVLGLVSMALNSWQYTPSTALKRFTGIENTVTSQSVAQTLIQGNCTTTPQQGRLNEYSFSEHDYYGSQCRKCPLLKQVCIRGNTLTQTNTPMVFPYVMNFIENSESR
jgi:hypothetical protein